MFKKKNINVFFIFDNLKISEPEWLINFFLRAGSPVTENLVNLQEDRNSLHLAIHMSDFESMSINTFSNLL